MEIENGVGNDEPLDHEEKVTLIEPSFLRTRMIQVLFMFMKGCFEMTGGEIERTI